MNPNGDKTADQIRLEEAVKTLTRETADLKTAVEKLTDALREFTRVQAESVERMKALERRVEDLEKDHDPCRTQVITNTQKLNDLVERVGTNELATNATFVSVRKEIEDNKEAITEALTGEGNIRRETDKGMLGYIIALAVCGVSTLMGLIALTVHLFVSK